MINILIGILMKVKLNLIEYLVLLKICIEHALIKADIVSWLMCHLLFGVTLRLNQSKLSSMLCVRSFKTWN